MFLSQGVKRPPQGKTAVFPLSIASDGRHLVDATGAPFRIHGVAGWDIHIALTQTDWRTALDTLKSQGINAVHTYTMNSVPYGTGGPQPANQAGQKPWSQNTAGGAWAGTFANSDAAFDHPNDAYWTTVASFVDDCATRGILVILHYMYAGAFHTTVGDKDGWWGCLTNAHNTTGVCQGFGTYLATGSGTFTGFASRSNILWLMQGDSGIGDSTIGSTGSTRMQNILTSMQSGGCNQLVGQHITHDNLPDDMTDYASFYNVRCAYTTPVTTGESYAECRAVYAESTTRPAFALEMRYWGDGGMTRAQVRYEIWGAALSCIGGAINSFTPWWEFFSSTDGTTGGVTTDCLPNCWVASNVYTLNQYAHLGGNWYRVITGGTSASSGGPTGTGTNITDGSVHWTYVTTVSSTLGGMANLFNEPGLVDHSVLGEVMTNVPWWLLVPTGLNGMGTIVTSGAGTQTAFSDGTTPSGTGDWIVSAAATDGSCVMAYVPHPHSGAFSVDMTKLARTSNAYWIDPTNGQGPSNGVVAGTNLSPTGTHSFTVPAVANAGGDNDWVLVILAANRTIWV
jgi:hypothetical protein